MTKGLHIIVISKIHITKGLHITIVICIIQIHKINIIIRGI